MPILVVNSGSSSLKLSLFAGHELIWKAQVDGRGQDSQLTIEQKDRAKQSCLIDAGDETAIGRLFESIWSGNHTVLSALSDIEYVGHRVVHGGRKYADSVLICDAVIAELREFIELAPQHEAANIRAIEIARRTIPQAMHVAVFDTAYHHGMPLASSVYAGPFSWYEELGIRRYGFHGINHQYCAQRASELLSHRPATRIITCHLGSGGSLCASLAGKSVMTTMGFTPLEGLVMRTRCGSIDPGLVLHLLYEKKYSVDELLRVLNEESGLKGISGLTGDMRELEAELAAGNPRAKLAFDIYEQNLAANICALVPTLGALDALVFTGGIGENSALVRDVTCKRLKFLGVEIDESKNLAAQKSDRDISAEGAGIATLVIPAREDLTVANECRKLIKS